MTQSPLNDALTAAAAQVAGDTLAAAQPIQQGQQEQQNHAVQQTQPVYAMAQPNNASPLTMDSNIVQAQSGITEYFKLTDGGCSVGDVKYEPIKVLLRLEDAASGGSFKPAMIMNYDTPAGMVYTKSYDMVSTVSNNPAHSGLGWNANKAKILTVDGKAYEYLGYDLAMVVAEDALSKDKKTTLAAGTVLGYSTPYLASKLLKKVWDAGMAANMRGKDAVLMVSGIEINKSSKNYKQLVVENLGYAEPKNFGVSYDKTTADNAE